MGGPWDWLDFTVGYELIEVWEVSIAFRGEPYLLIDVPTTLGREAAERRAVVTAFRQLDKDVTRRGGELDELSVMSSRLQQSIGKDAIIKENYRNGN